MRNRSRIIWTGLVLAAGLCGNGRGRAEQSAAAPLWEIAQAKAAIHRFSTLFTAQDVRQALSTEEGRSSAIDWCRATGVTEVYLEVFRDGYRAEREALAAARDRFRQEGFLVHGCVTTTRVGKRSTGWEIISCCTNRETQTQLADIFRFGASLFDVIMIDDFWFTDCECGECRQAKGNQSWSQYRRQLMCRVSRECVLAPARDVNPRVRLIIKYPEWYDRFHERGYDVVAESELFDVTWIGTETRDPDNPRWGRKPQYGAYWISLWARAFSGGKLGGGWFDPLGTTPRTYVEQARQTILGQCRNSLLFCYGALQREHGPLDVEALRPEIPGLLQLAEFVHGEEPRGVGTYKPPQSDSGADAYVFNFLGMLGMPMTAGTSFPLEAPSLLVTEHAAADADCEAHCLAAAEAGKTVLLTSNLRGRLSAAARQQLNGANVHVLQLDPGEKTDYGVLKSVRDLMRLAREELDAWRKPLLEPLGVELSAPPLVAVYLYGPRKVVLENFRDEPADVTLALRDATGYEPSVVLPPQANVSVQAQDGRASITLPPRALLALTAASP